MNVNSTFIAVVKMPNVPTVKGAMTAIVTMDSLAME